MKTLKLLGIGCFTLLIAGCASYYDTGYTTAYYEPDYSPYYRPYSYVYDPYPYGSSFSTSIVIGGSRHHRHYGGHHFSHDFHRRHG